LKCKEKIINKKINKNKYEKENDKKCERGHKIHAGKRKEQRI